MKFTFTSLQKTSYNHAAIRVLSPHHLRKVLGGKKLLRNGSHGYGKDENELKCLSSSLFMLFLFQSIDSSVYAHLVFRAFDVTSCGAITFKVINNSFFLPICSLHTQTCYIKHSASLCETTYKY